MSRLDRALHGQCKSSARGVRKNRSGRLWRHECALHLGKNTQRPNELANVRSNAARNKCGRYTWRRIWRPRRRLFPNIGLQQSRERRGSRTPVERAYVAAVDSLVPTRSPSRAFPSTSLGSAGSIPPNRRCVGIASPPAIYARRVTFRFGERSPRGRGKTKSASALPLLFSNAG